MDTFITHYYGTLSSLPCYTVEPASHGKF